MITSDPTPAVGLHAYAVEAVGEGHLLVTFTDASPEDRWRHAHSVCRTLDAYAYDAVLSTYPAYDSVLIEFDAVRIDADGMTRIVRGIATGYSAADEQWLGDTALYRLPILFGGEIVPIAAELGLSVDELVEREVDAPIRIRCRAVGGGLMMLNHETVPPVARLASPELRDALGGEFNLAGHQCSIGLSIGRATTGWRTIGRTPVDVRTEFLKPSPTYNVGDRIQLEPIRAEDWSQHAGRPVALAGAVS